MKSSFIALLTFAVVAHLALPSASASDLCITSKGLIAARKKCKKTESKFQLSSVTNLVKDNLIAPSGPAGEAGGTGSRGHRGAPGAPGPIGLSNKVPGPRGLIDFSACHRVVSGAVTTSAQISIITSCDSESEFVFEDEWTISGGRGFIQNNSKLLSLGNNNENLPYAINITANSPTGDSYTLTVKVLCCPR